MANISFEQMKWTSKNQLAFYKYVRDEEQGTESDEQ